RRDNFRLLKKIRVVLLFIDLLHIGPIRLFTFQQMNQWCRNKGIDYVQDPTRYHLFEFSNDDLQRIGTLIDDGPYIEGTNGMRRNRRQPLRSRFMPRRSPLFIQCWCIVKTQWVQHTYKILRPASAHPCSFSDSNTG